MVLAANWRLASAKSPKVHKNNPEAVCMDEIGRAERKSSVQAISRQLICFVNGCNFFLGQADSDLFVHFEETASCINASTTCWLEPTLSTYVRCRALIGAYLLCCLVCGLTAPCCAVLAEQRKQRNSGRFPYEFYYRRQLQAGTYCCT